MRLQMKVTAYHMVDNLSSGLYKDPGRCLNELIRNAVVVSMPHPGIWDPTHAQIEIYLADSHPLSPDRGPALIVLDHGPGLTDPALERYFNWLGTPLYLLQESMNGNGASQKGIGRLAALALNERCLHDDISVKVANGYYLFSRTEKSGKVRFVSIIPEQVEQSQGFETDRFIASNATEMGPFKNIPGTFTALVIPTPVFKTDEEIYEAVKWYLPREKDKMFTLTVGRHRAEPPPLEKEVNHDSEDGRFRARLGAGTSDDDGGCWLCDSETGLRVASCQQLGGRLLPEPLWFPDIKGDIFAPGMLKYQNTARDMMSPKLMKKGNKDWAHLSMFLIRDIAPQAKVLLGRDIISGDAAKALDDVVDLFEKRFGAAEDLVIEKRTHKPRHEPEPPDPGRPPGGNGGGPPPKDRPKRYVSIRVRDETFTLYRGRSLHPDIFAQVNPQNGNMIFVNVRGGFGAMPQRKEAQRENILLQILSAVAQHKFPSDPHAATMFVNSVRRDFLQK